MLLTIKSIYRCDSVGYKAIGTYDHDGMKENGSVTLFWDNEERQYSINQEFWLKDENPKAGTGWKKVSNGSREFRHILQSVADMTGISVTTPEPLIFNQW